MKELKNIEPIPDHLIESFVQMLLAAQYGHEANIMESLEKGINPNTRDAHGRSALHIASLYGHANVVAILLEHGANVNQEDERRGTPLLMAAEQGHIEVVRLLLDAAACVDCLDEQGAAAIHFASQNNHHAIAKLLLDRGANPNMHGYKEATPLFLAAAKGHHEMVKLLIAHGAEPDLSAKNGYTALMIACLNGYANVVDVLLTSGADPEQEDANGKTPDIYNYQGKISKEIMERLARARHEKLKKKVERFQHPNNQSKITGKPKEKDSATHKLTEVEKCPKCGQGKEGKLYCPHCGNVEWSSIIFILIIGLGLLMLSAFWFKQEWLRISFAIVGVIITLAIITTIVDALKSRQ